MDRGAALPGRHPSSLASPPLGVGLAAWMALALWLSAFFVDDILRMFCDPHGYQQERDALRRAAVALYTAGDHLGHGLAVLAGVAFWLGRCLCEPLQRA